MRFAALIVLSACSFQPRAAVTGGGDDAAPVDVGRDDAAIDARPIDAPPDAPPDACSDQDGDGTCDDGDDWQCGVLPASPPPMVMTSPGAATTATLTTIAVAGTQLVRATPNQALAVTFHYKIVDTACPGNCVDQLEVGWVPGDRAGCVFDQAVSKMNGAQGTASGTFQAPGMRGLYDLRVAVGQNYSCNYNNAHTWYHGQPDVSTTIAKVCVH